ncbi:MAG TPA: hypothetical protein VEY95_11925 [Azospirillaceae bacterium]|nr:hypothetical protein [Azospirillaceae bacterium]
MTNNYGGRDEGDRARGAAELGIGGFDLGSLGNGYGDGRAPSPEMGGGPMRGRGLDAVAALGRSGGNVNAASAVMRGEAPTFGDHLGDFLGSGTPGGFFGSNAANLGFGLLGAILGGLPGGFLAAGAHALARGENLGQAATTGALGLGASALGGQVGPQTSAAYGGRGNHQNGAQTGGLLDRFLDGGQGAPGGPAGNDSARDELSKLTGGLTPAPAPQPQAPPTPRIFDPLRGIWYTV